MNYNGLDANFSKALSNDFNRLGEKWANRREIHVSFPDHVDLCHQESTDFSGSERICERLIYMIQYLTCTCKNRSQRCLSENLNLLGRIHQDSKLHKINHIRLPIGIPLFEHLFVHR